MLVQFVNNWMKRFRGQPNWTACSSITYTIVIIVIVIVIVIDIVIVIVIVQYVTIIFKKCLEVVTYKISL